MLSLLAPVVDLSLDSLMVGVLAARLMPRFPALPYALAFGLSDAFAAMLGHATGLEYGMIIWLAFTIGVATIHRKLNPAVGWRTAAGTALPLVFGLDSLACPIAAADVPVLALTSTSLALLGLLLGRAAGCKMPAAGEAVMLALVGLMLFV